MGDTLGDGPAIRVASRRPPLKRHGRLKCIQPGERRIQVIANGLKLGVHASGLSRSVHAVAHLGSGQQSLREIEAFVHLVELAPKVVHFAPHLIQLDPG